MKELIPVHIGLVGHIDHGKTALARRLSEKVSTAGLDKHPQAQERGITIDLGFTMFVADDFLVTLVDAPGHADLIRSVIAGSNIIDSAILVVAADEGPMVQTGEHIVILRAMDIDTLVVALTKIDLVSENQLNIVEKQTQLVLDGADFKRVEFVRTSAKSGEGIEELKRLLQDIVKPKTRDSSGPFLMPLDHAFPVKGYGTIVTGTIQRGAVKTGDTVQIMPQGKTTRVRSIQTFGEPRSTASAGDRVGMNTPEISHSEVSRGNYLSKIGHTLYSRLLLAGFDRNPLYKGRIASKMVVSATVGMASATAEIVPVEREGGDLVVVADMSSRSFDAAILLQRNLVVESGMRVLLMRTDLPPTHMRIIGSGRVEQAFNTLLLKKRKKRIGRITRVREEDVLVEGLASSKRVAESLSGLSVRTSDGIVGTLGRPFGTRGVLTATFEGDVSESTDVVYERMVEEEFAFGR
ncbi:MAG: selenocysteine-specific translation elongation factor [Promethearchaeota archaeon]